eukprot:7314178-Alexandrium_andersonii.AAC.1
MAQSLLLLPLPVVGLGCREPGPPSVGLVPGEVVGPRGPGRPAAPGRARTAKPQLAELIVLSCRE